MLSYGPSRGRAGARTQLGTAREMVLLSFGIAFVGTVSAFALGRKELAREVVESRLRKRDKDDDHLTHV